MQTKSIAYPPATMMIYGTTKDEGKLRAKH